ncbi:hypothetical protein AB0A94_15895 [Streptomyces sp. NPDC044984]|uniref:hypothetical protein n=1 Tax=Streptomyces sp. NPDC044984 TaxID=3154335 RepID=UPI0034070BAF
MEIDTTVTMAVLIDLGVQEPERMPASCARKDGTHPFAHTRPAHQGVAAPVDVRSAAVVLLAVPPVTVPSFLRP